MWKMVDTDKGEYELHNPSDGKLIPIFVVANSETGEVKLFASNFFNSKKEIKKIIKSINELAIEKLDKDNIKELDQGKTEPQKKSKSKFSNWGYEQKP